MVVFLWKVAAGSHRFVASLANEPGMPKTGVTA